MVKVGKAVIQSAFPTLGEKVEFMGNRKICGFLAVKRIRFRWPENGDIRLGFL
mgnify:CR=1 FL=1